MKTVLAAIVAALALCACASATAPKLQTLQLGMTEAQIKQRLGDPEDVRGAIINKYGQDVVVWEYELTLPKTGNEYAADSTLTVLTLGLGAPLFAIHRHKPYWLFFVNKRLVQWGRAGDWQATAHYIYDVHFTASAANHSAKQKLPQ